MAACLRQYREGGSAGVLRTPASSSLLRASTNTSVQRATAGCSSCSLPKEVSRESRATHLVAILATDEKFLGAASIACAVLDLQLKHADRSGTLSRS